MVSRICFGVIFSLLSCKSIELKKISDSSSIRVPKNINFFKKYDEKLNVQSPKDIDLTSVYEYVYQIDYENRKFYNTKTSNTSAFKFYKDGRVNLFYYDLKKKVIFDSSKQGYRGICYKQENNFKLLLVVPVTENRKYGIQNYNVKIRGDTLLISMIKKHFTKEQIFTDIYVKKYSYNNIQTDW